ncbi:MAG: WXG100 family type VII secretion target [Anaerolineae bacterium]|nr:WXG100 family type VII secretion target [Anaerolineae bacterium]MDQ7037246.1 WXG100 family type VII secretion target [Anaerolineae bacterium]
MSDFIRVPYVELYQRAARIRQEADSVRAEIQRLEEAVETVQWMGKRAERFFQMWERARPEMQQWVTALEAFARSLENQARRMQAADEAF